MAERDSELDHDGVNVNFKVAGGNEDSLFVSEVVADVLAGKFITSEDYSVFGNIGSDGDIRGALVEVEVVSLQVVVFVLVEVGEFEVVDNIDQLVEVDVFGLGEDINVD